MSYQQWEEKRRYKRYPSDLSAHFKPIREDAGEPVSGTLMNVSRGGMFVRTANSLRPGTELEITINVVNPFGEEQEIKAQAKVMWVNTKPNEPGMGLSFTKIDRHSQYAILACAYRGTG